MAIYIAAHKAFAPPALTGYIPLQVGAALHERLPCIGDDSGEHISSKNPHYCELTGTYWVWKNTADPYKGLVHYRRYFTRRGRLLTEQDVQALLTDHDVILPRTEYLRQTAQEEFCLYSGRRDDLAKLRQAVADTDPSVLPAYDRVMADNRLHLYNMLVAPAPVFDRYCAWLFAVLSRLEAQVDMHGYTPYEQRLYGFAGERLTTVWFAHTQARIAALPVVNTEDTAAQRLRMTLRRQKNRLLFHP